MSLSIQSGDSKQPNKFTHSVKGVGSGFLSPFKRAFGSIADGVGGLFEGISYSNYQKLKKEFAEVNEKLQKYGFLITENSELKSENYKLRKVLELKKRLNYETIPALIISKDPDNWYNTIVINKGSENGIKVDMPVVGFVGDKQAVVGKIIEVRGSVSRILPINSPRFKIGVKMEGTNFPGLLYGFSSSSEFCIMDYISRAAQIKQNDLVLTSSQAGIFPSGILIGKIVKSKILESGSYQRAIVVPVINYDLLDYVYVIKKDPDVEFLKIFEAK